MREFSVRDAEVLLDWANEKNPGPWFDHSREVAAAASKIASAAGMDGNRAYVLGLLHDIGRYKGFSAMRHIVDGYELMKKKGDEQAAQICITHSFPLQRFDAYSGEDDCDEAERATVMSALEGAKYTAYDELIQLCDALALPAGVCLMEKRLVDVALRHGVNEMTIPKWQKLFSIFQTFESQMEGKIYDLFPEIAENTFLL